MDAAESDLVQRARSGDGPAMDELLARHLPLLRAFVRLQMPAELRLRESCSDVVQSVCREILTKDKEFEYRGPEAFRGWLCTWARHKILDRVRYWAADKRAPELAAAAGGDGNLDELASVYRSVASPSGQAVRNEEVLLLEQAFERLPEEYREVIGLCRIAGLSREEVGRLMGGRTPGAVRAMLNRALVQLAGELERLGVEG